MSSEDLAAYLSRRLSAPERRAVEQHLADCESCRSELVSAQRVLANRRRPARVAGGIGILAIAAAIMAILMVPGAQSVGRNDVESEPLYRAVGDAPRLRVLSPEAESVMPDSAIVFRWEAAAAHPLYRIALLAESGETIWTLETADTSVVFPRVLVRGARYIWYVDAISSTGDSITSGPTSFLVR